MSSQPWEWAPLDNFYGVSANLSDHFYRVFREFAWSRLQSFRELECHFTKDLSTPVSCVSPVWAWYCTTQCNKHTILVLLQNHSRFLSIFGFNGFISFYQVSEHLGLDRRWPVCVYRVFCSFPASVLDFNRTCSSKFPRRHCLLFASITCCFSTCV